MSDPSVKTALLKSKDGQSFQLNVRQMTFGRAESSDLCLTDQGISRNHAILLFENGTWFIQDLSPRNPTKLNGSKIEHGKATRLREGNTLRFGRTNLKFEYAEIPSGSETTGKQTVFVSARDSDVKKVMEQLDVRRGASRSRSSEMIYRRSSDSGSESSRFPTQDLEVEKEEAAPPDALGWLEERSTSARRYYLRKLVTRIGTSPRDCDLVVSDTSMDLQHAEIRFEKGRIKILDLNSKGGTRIDEGRLVRTGEIRDGCRITLGRSNFTFNLLQKGHDFIAQESRKSGTAKRRVLLAVTVLLVLAGLGGAWYWQELQKEMERKAAENRIEAPPVQEPGFPEKDYLRDIELALRQNDLEGARMKASNAEEQAPNEELRRQFNHIEENIASYAEITRLYDEQRYVTALSRIEAFQPDELLVSRAQELDGQIRLVIGDEARRLVRSISRFERDADWEKAREHAIELRELNLAEYAAEADLSLKRISVKQRLDSIYQSEYPHVSTNYRSIRERISGNLSDIRSELQKEPVLSESDVQPWLQNLENIRAHAEFLTDYEDFDGTTAAYRRLRDIVDDPDRLSSGYDGRSELNELLVIAEDLRRIRTEKYQRLCEEYHDLAAGQTASVGSAISAILACLKEMEDRTGDQKRHNVNTWIVSERKTWNGEFTQEIAFLWRQAEDAGRATSPSGSERMEGLLAHLRIIRDILMLYPDEVRQKGNIATAQELQRLIGDSQRYRVFADSWKMYITLIGEVRETITGAIYNNDPLIIREAPGYLDRLGRLTIPEDLETGNQIEALLSRL